MLALLWLVPFAGGTAIGLSGIVVRRLPLISAATFLFVYVVFVGWYGIRTAACPHCSAGDGDRLYYLPLLAGFYGIALGAVAARPFAQKRRKRSQPT
jgi:hypothetical protein